MSDHTKPSDATLNADRAAVDAPHGAAQELTPEQEEAAEGNTVSDSTRESYPSMTEKGASQQGEGRLP